MEIFIPKARNNIDKFILTPDHVGGLSISETEDSYGSLGLFTKLEHELDVNGLSDNPEVVLAMHLGLALHANDERTNGHYTNHIMRVCLRILANYGINDPSVIAAALLHDTVEDHPKDIVRVLGGKIDDSLSDEEKALAALRLSPLSAETVDIVDLVTCPLLDLEHKQRDYIAYTEKAVITNPKSRIVKLSDFVDNAVGNHYTVGSKQHKLDKKYLPLYRIHKLGLLMPDSLIIGEVREECLKQLTKGQFRAISRIALASEVS